MLQKKKIVWYLCFGARTYVFACVTVRRSLKRVLEIIGTQHVEVCRRLRINKRVNETCSRLAHGIRQLGLNRGNTDGTEVEDGNFIPRRRTGSSNAAITTGDTVFLSSTDRDLLSDVDYACARTCVYTSTRAAHHKPHVSAQCIIKKEASRLSSTVTNIP